MTAWPPARLLAERRYDADTLATWFPAPPHHPHKRLLRELAWPRGPEVAGRLHVSRWQGSLAPVVHTTPVAVPVVVRDDAFAYEDVPGEVHWHVNFADPDLFGFHAGPLFAQDEIQVAEHPLLACVRHALVDDHFPARTTEDGRPTPILVADVQRHLSIDLAPRPGAPGGLYGNRFASSDPDALRAATTVLRPPTVSNIAAMAALRGGGGRYRLDEIACTLATALTTFSAAREVSGHLHGTSARVVMHSGFWGCGAFGGHRVLLPALQIVAARAAGLDRLEMHALGDGGPRVMHEAVAVAGALPADDLRAAVRTADAMGFCWGTPDGH